MIPEVEQSIWVVVFYWLLMFPIAVMVLVRTTNFWADDGPGTVFEAVRTTLATGLVVFLTYDLSGYFFARLMQSPQLGIVFPVDYGYWDWIREPLCLKWQVLGFVPVIRYLPVLFALTAGSTLQIFWWKISFRQGLLAFVSQIALNVIAMTMLSFVFVFFIGMREGATASSAPTANNQRQSTAAERRDRDRSAQAASNASPGGLAGFQQRVRELGVRKGPFAGGIREKWESINQVFEPGYAFFQPITRYLPLFVQDFLNAGGWLFAGPSLAAFGWYGWRNRYRRSRSDLNNAQ
ncbi:MAG: hypothetical protein NTW52_00795 [Planctomycetota bacterium]|nr:hypothetical protein [Planctomycetota bacterium]